MGGRIKMVKDSVAKVSEKALRLQEYLRTKKEGDVLSYDKIQHDTKIEMNQSGKAYLRTAFKRLRKLYSTISGYGVKVADKDDAMPILVNRLGRIDRAVKRADNTKKNVESQFFDTLSASEQKEILYLGAVFGAIRVAADNGKLVYRKKNNEMSDSTLSISLPSR